MKNSEIERIKSDLDKFQELREEERKLIKEQCNYEFNSPKFDEYEELVMKVVNKRQILKEKIQKQVDSLSFIL